jgi:PAS domain-containing protein
MKGLPWRYAWQLIALIVIATIAANSTVSLISDQLESSTRLSGMAVQVSILAVWAMVVGFMFLIGGFGLWTIRFAAETETRRRIGGMIDAMSSIKDGLISLDRKGRMTGSNAAAGMLAVAPLQKNASLLDGFPCLSEDDLTLLLNISGPNEIERDQPAAGRSRTLRFRSQPSEGVILIIVSDVTAMLMRERRRQQMTRWQLIGRIARGVAYDFNNILCVISGHLSLISRAKLGSQDMRDSLDTMRREADKGGMIAANLLNLSNWAAVGRPTALLGEHVRRALSLLGASLETGWRIESHIDEDFPAVALSGVQVEQLMLNLGLLAADTVGAPGILRVTVCKPGKDHLVDVGAHFAAVILISAASPSAAPSAAPPQAPAIAPETEEEGVVHSIVTSMLESAGGYLNVLKESGGLRIYRAILPYGNLPSAPAQTEELPAELRAHVANWKIISAGSARHHREVDKALSEMGVRVEALQDIVSVLAHVETERALDAVLLDRELLGQQAEGLLRAVAKLRPDAGIVVLCEDPDAEPEPRPRSVVFAAHMRDPARLIKSLLEAKALATSQRGR